VNSSWIDYLAMTTKDTFSTNDFRATSRSAFQALSTFCKLIDSMISDSLIQFYSRQYVSASVMSLQLFESETKLLVDQLRSLMTNSFLFSRLIIRDTTQANALFSGLETNYKLSVKKNTSIHIEVLTYSGCSCFGLKRCIEQSSIYEYPKMISLYDVPGFYTGCYVVESLLQSTLECFYDQTCINGLQVYLPSSSSMNITALDLSLSTNYSKHSKIEDLVNNLMIEQWNATYIYDRYYNECQPTQCSYILQTRNDAIYVVTTLFGIAGGLTTVLKLVVPILVKLIMYCIRKLRRRVAPLVPIVQT
jgi:hypothetical protein